MLYANIREQLFAQGFTQCRVQHQRLNTHFPRRKHCYQRLVGILTFESEECRDRNWESRTRIRDIGAKVSPAFGMIVD
nr:hypothetical protein [Enterovibrio nigricans]